MAVRASDLSLEFGREAQVQFHSLPEDAREALIEKAVELADQPWDAAIKPPGADIRFREAVFGSGNGLLGFYLRDEPRPPVDLRQVVPQRPLPSANWRS
jgi:hypothetical protein